MALFEEIDKAIAAHGAWKTRLKDAINTGKLDVPVSTIRCNDQCAFGKWLYGPTMPLTERVSPGYKAVVDLHTQFHKVAAAVAELALAGKKAEAEKALGATSEFTQISSRLTAAMMEWKKSQTAAATH